MPTRYCVVFMTAPDASSAEKIALELVKARLAACVTRFPGALSVYSWEGKIESAQEVALFAKTSANLIPELIEFVRKIHPHSVPEILALPVEAGYSAYLDWIGAHTVFTKPKRFQAPRGD